MKLISQKDRCRSLPIPESISPVPNYPSKLRIYKTSASQYLQVQSFFKGKTYRQSLRTTSKAVAFRGAKEFFHLKVAKSLAAKCLNGQIEELCSAILSIPH